jgi:hypothetical protein
MKQSQLKQIIKEEIKKILKEEITNNIWDSYQMIIFDVLPNKEVIEDLILKAINSNLVTPKSKESWEKKGIKKFAKEFVVPFSFSTPTLCLYIDPTYNSLNWGSDPSSVLKKNPTIPSINYSEIK